MGGIVDRVLWLFGGKGPKGLSKQVWSVDLGELRWEQHPDMPSVRSGGTAAWDGEGAFVVVGGCWTDDCDPVIRFDLEAQSWTPLASAPGNRINPGVVFVGSELWMLGGKDPATGASLKDQWSYESGWTSLGDVRTVPDSEGVAVSPVSGVTEAGGSGGVVTFSSGWLARWTDGLLQAVNHGGLLGATADCLWVNDDSVFIWSEGLGVECEDQSLYCVEGEGDARGSVSGTLCAPIDATLWTYGGGSVEDGTVSDALWRYHSEQWTWMMDGGTEL